MGAYAYRTQQQRARKLWFPYRGLGARWFGRGVVVPPPRLVQLLSILRCAVLGHRWSQWRVETLEWFEYVDHPQPYAWHGCKRGCGALERVVEYLELSRD